MVVIILIINIVRQSINYNSLGAINGKNNISS